MIASQIAILIALMVAFNVIRRRGMPSVRAAQEILRQGALLIDVRTAGEFASGHLPGAINLPLGDFERLLPERVKDKDKPLLLHCQSGMRSGAARHKARGLGYTKVLNLGSYGRAERIVRTAKLD